MNPTTSQQALTQLQGAQQAQQTPQQLTDAANTQFGVNGAQQQVTGLRSAIQNTTNLLNQVAPGVMGRTGNSLVTSAQANRIIQNEQAPISATLGKQTTDYTNAENDYKDLLGKAESSAQLNAAGQQQKMSYLQQLYSDLYGQEQDAAKSAEAQREFNVQASQKSSGGGGGSSKSSSSSSNAPLDYNSQPVTAWTDYIHQNFHGQNWGQIATQIEKSTGQKIPGGSNLDQALHYIFTGVY